MPTLESIDSISPLEQQDEGSAGRDNSTCSSVKAGENVNGSSSSWVEGEPDYEAIDQVSKSELGPVGEIIDRERHDVTVRSVETEWMRRLPHLWAVIGEILVMATLLVMLSAGIKELMSEDLMGNSISIFHVAYYVAMTRR